MSGGGVVAVEAGNDAGTGRRYISTFIVPPFGGPPRKCGNLCILFSIERTCLPQPVRFA